MPIGLFIFFPNKVDLNISSSLFSSDKLGIKFNFKDLIAKLCAVSGSILKIRDLNFENIILFFLLLIP